METRRPLLRGSRAAALLVLALAAAALSCTGPSSQQGPPALEVTSASTALLGTGALAAASAPSETASGATPAAPPEAARKVQQTGPSRTFRYRLTLVGSNYGRPEPDGMRTTWSLSIGGEWAALHVVRESLSDSVYLSGDVDKAPWQKIDEARFEGTCEGIYSISCLSDAAVYPEIRINLERLPAMGQAFHDTPAIAWRCSEDTVRALPARARIRESDCSGPGPGSSWIPSTRASHPGLRCDGLAVPEPSPASQLAPRGTRSPVIPMGLRFVEGRGVEWVFEQHDCSLPGVLRLLP